MEKQYYLGKLDINWADEADFVYFDIYDEDGKNELVDALNKLGNNEVSLYFGTNEEGEYSGNDLNDSIEWIKIPNEEIRKFLEENVCDYHNSMSEVLESVWSDDNYDDEDYDDEDYSDEEDYKLDDDYSEDDI